MFVRINYKRTAGFFSSLSLSLVHSFSRSKAILLTYMCLINTIIKVPNPRATLYVQLMQIL